MLNLFICHVVWYRPDRFCQWLSVYIPDSIKVALGIGNLLFGAHSSKSLHCSMWTNDQSPKPPFFDLAVYHWFHFASLIRPSGSLSRRHFRGALACVAGIERGKGRGNLAARVREGERKGTSPPPSLAVSRPHFPSPSLSKATQARGAPISSLPTNACLTEDNIPFPSLASHVVLSKLWRADLDRRVTR